MGVVSRSTLTSSSRQCLIKPTSWLAKFCFKKLQHSPSYSTFVLVIPSVLPFAHRVVLPVEGGSSPPWDWESVAYYCLSTTNSPFPKQPIGATYRGLSPRNNPGSLANGYSPQILAFQVTGILVPPLPPRFADQSPRCQVLFPNSGGPKRVNLYFI